MSSKILTKIIKNIFSFYGKYKKPTYITYDEHKINIRSFSKNAIKVCVILREYGYESYIVGGAIRDIIIGIKPKDFDIVTNATPEEIKNIFKKSKIIGKRFKIVHILINQELIEVSTFRSSKTPHTKDSFGRIIRDNIFGSHKDDAKRRDFTINALYYDPIKEEIIDFHNGYSDLINKDLVIIGNPEQRYREDPIRMLRAFRFASKLDIDISNKTYEPIKNMGYLLNNVPNSRLLDEIIKMFMCGRSLKCLEYLEETELIEKIFIYKNIRNKNKNFLELVLQNTDDRIHEGKHISTSFLLASIMWPVLFELWQKIHSDGEHLIPALIIATRQILNNQNKKLIIQQKFCSEIREIWFMQPRFEKLNKKNITKMIAQPRFRSACNFFFIRSLAKECDKDLASWWMNLANSNEEIKENIINEISDKKMITKLIYKEKLLK